MPYDRCHCLLSFPHWAITASHLSATINTATNITCPSTAGLEIQMSKTIEEVKAVIKQDILMNRLELGDAGISLADLHDDTLLMDDNGLALDSVDTLDIVVAIEEYFGFAIEQVDANFFDNHVSTIESLAQYIIGRLANKEAEALAS
jgi:acyl carrier protein